MLIDQFFIGQIFIIIYISVCSIYFCFNSANKNILKLIGGSILILVSLYAKSDLVYVFTVIISGLIIASERFMSLLVAILKADKSFLVSDNFPKILDKMSTSEIAAKEQTEIEEIKTTEILVEDKQKIEPDNNRTFSLSNKKLIASMSLIENAAINKLEKALETTSKRQIKFGEILLDAVIEKRNGTTYFIEVKYFPSPKGKISEGKIAHQIETRVKHFIPSLLLKLNNELANLKTEEHFLLKSKKYVLLIVIVVESDIDLKNIMERISYFKQIFNSPNQNVNVKFVFYNGSKLELNSSAKN